MVDEIKSKHKEKGEQLTSGAVGNPNGASSSDAVGGWEGDETRRLGLGEAGEILQSLLSSLVFLLLLPLFIYIDLYIFRRRGGGGGGASYSSINKPSIH